MRAWLILVLWLVCSVAGAIQVQSGQADVTTYFVLRDSTNHAPKTDVTVTDIDLYYVESGAAISTKADASALAAATTAHTDNNAFNVGQGLYRIDWPDAAFDTGVGKTTTLIVVCSGVDTTFLDVELSPPSNVTEWKGVTAPANTGDAYARLGAPAGASIAADLVTIDDFVDTEVAAIKTKTDYLPSATAGAAGGVFIAGTNAATTITTALTTTFTGNLTGSVGSVTGAVGSVTGAVGSVTGAVGSVTGNVGGNVTGSVGSVASGGITATSIAADAIGASELATDAVTEMQTGLATATALATVDDFVDTEVAAILADTNELQTDWVNGGRLDLILDATATASALSTVSGYVDTEVAAILADTNELQTDWVNGGRLDLILDATATASGMTSAFSEIKGVSWSSLTDTLDVIGGQVTSIPTTAQNADAVWDELLSGHVVAGSAGVYLAGASAPSAASVADAVWDEVLSGHLTGGTTGNALNAAGAAGDPWSTALPGSYVAGTAGKIIGDNLNATISSRASQTSVDTVDDYVDTEVGAIKTKTDYLPSATAGAAGGVFIAGSNAATSVTTAFTANITGNLSGSVGSVTSGVIVTANNDKTGYSLTTAPLDAAGTRSALGLATANLDTQLGAIDDYVDGEVALILADTNELQTDWANGGRLDTLLDATATSTGVTAAFTEIKGATWNSVTDTLDVIGGAVGGGGTNVNVVSVNGVPVASPADFGPDISDFATVEDLLNNFTTVNDTLSNFATATETAEAVWNDDLSDNATTGSAATMMKYLGNGTGYVPVTYRLTLADNTPVADATVWVTSDVAGTNRIATSKTNASGYVSPPFMLNPGTVYIWRAKSGNTWTNPVTKLVVAPTP